LIVVPPGFVDVENPLLGGGAFYRGVFEDGVYLSVLNKGAAQVFVYDLELSLHSNLRGQSGVENELLRYLLLTRS